MHSVQSLAGARCRTGRAAVDALLRSLGAGCGVGPGGRDSDDGVARPRRYQRGGDRLERGGGGAPPRSTTEGEPARHGSAPGGRRRRGAGACRLGPNCWASLTSVTLGQLFFPDQCFSTIVMSPVRTLLFAQYLFPVFAGEFYWFRNPTRCGDLVLLARLLLSFSALPCLLFSFS